MKSYTNRCIDVIKLQSNVIHYTIIRMHMYITVALECNFDSQSSSSVGMPRAWLHGLPVPVRLMGLPAWGLIAVAVSGSIQYWARLSIMGLRAPPMGSIVRFGFDLDRECRFRVLFSMGSIIDYRASGSIHGLDCASAVNARYFFMELDYD